LFARASSGVNTNIVAQCFTANCFVYSVVAGVATQILPSYAGTWAIGATHQMTLKVNGTAISLLLDGVTVVSGTNAGVSAIGQGGFRVMGGTLSKMSNFFIQ
jgi:hypothetical protein